MCIASKFVNELQSMSDRIKNELKNMNKMLSQYDKEIASLYHKIEAKNFNAAEGYCLSKDLQTILRKRRTVKQEIRKLHSLTHTIDIQSLPVKAKANLSKIHKSENEWKSDWKENYRFEDLLLQ